MDVFGDDLGPYGITVYMVLARLCYGGFTVKMGQREMAAHARMSKTELQRTLKTMIELGLVVERKGPTPKSISSYDLMDVKDLAEEMKGLLKERSSGAQSGPVRTRREDRSTESAQDAPSGHYRPNTPEPSDDAATEPQDAEAATEEKEASDLVLGRDSNWSSQDQMEEEDEEDADEPPKTVENFQNPASHVVLGRTTSGPGEDHIWSRGGPQYLRNKKKESKGTPPSGASAVENSFSEDPDQKRWASFIADLRRGMYDLALGIEVAKGWNPVREETHDFKTCFSAWWLLEVERGPSGATFLTHADDEAATEAGLVKYRKRLDKLLRKNFSLGKDAQVSFRVLRTAPGPTEEPKNAPSSPVEPKTGHGDELTNGEIAADDRDAWEELRRVAAEQLARMAQNNPAIKADWIEQGVNRAQLAEVHGTDGKRLWKLRSPAPATTRVVLELLAQPLLRRVVPGVEIQVLDEEQSP